MKNFTILAILFAFSMTACQTTESFDPVSGDVQITVETALPA